MQLYTPDMTHPEVNEILPYLMDGVAPPTAHQRALAACGKIKTPGRYRSPEDARGVRDDQKHLVGTAHQRALAACGKIKILGTYHSPQGAVVKT